MPFWRTNSVTDWESFQFDINYKSDKLRDDLINIEAFRLSLNKLILPEEWVRDLQKLHIVRSVHGTTAIEGNPLSEEEVARQLTSTRSERRTDPVHQQTRNAARAFRWVEGEFKTLRPFRVRDILEMHRLLTEGSDEGDNVPGQLRAGGHSVTVGSPHLGGVHQAPPGGQTTGRLVDGFVEFINSPRFQSEHAVVQALVANFYFVTLHPFGNGNGRTTRCIEAAILYGAGYNTYGFYSLSNYFYRHRDEYCRLLQETRTKYSYDLTALLQFGLRGFREELEQVNAYVRNRTHRLHYRELIRRSSDTRISKRRRLLNEREAKLLHAILDLSAPPDPFSDEAPKEASLRDLDATLDALYGKKTPRTVLREFVRLRDLGFIRYTRGADEADVRVAIEFQAIARY
jgi:Fic family protein